MLFVFISIFFLFPSSIHAQGYSISVSPHTYHVIMKPGARATLPLEATNSGDPLIIQFNPYIVKIGDTTTTPTLVPYYSDNPNLPIITLGDTNASIRLPFLINTQDSIEADITISVPKKTPMGDYFFALVAETDQSDRFQSSSTIALKAGTAARIVVSVSDSGKLDTGGNVVQYDVSPRVEFPFFGNDMVIVTRPSDMHLTMTLVNTGTNVTQAQGTMGVNLQTYSIPPTLLMAGEQRTFTFTDELKEARLGKVHAQVAIYFDANPNPIHTDVTFYILPAPLLMGVGGMVLIGLVMYILTKYAKT